MFIRGLRAHCGSVSLERILPLFELPVVKLELLRFTVSTSDLAFAERRIITNTSIETLTLGGNTLGDTCFVLDRLHLPTMQQLNIATRHLNPGHNIPLINTSQFSSIYSFILQDAIDSPSFGLPQLFNRMSNLRVAEIRDIETLSVLFFAPGEDDEGRDMILCPKLVELVFLPDGNWSKNGRDEFLDALVCFLESRLTSQQSNMCAEVKKVTMPDFGHFNEDIELTLHDIAPNLELVVR